MQYLVINVPVPTYEGFAIRPATIAYTRLSSRKIRVGYAICNTDKDLFQVNLGRLIADGRYTKKPLDITTGAYTQVGLENAIRNAVFSRITQLDTNE